MGPELLEEIMNVCSLQRGEELIPGKAYLYDTWYICRLRKGIPYFNRVEFILLTERGGKRVGIIYNMGNVDVHMQIAEEFQGRHILSNFARTGLLNEVWPELTETTICNISKKKEFLKRKHLAELFNLRVINETEIIRTLKEMKGYDKAYINEHKDFFRRLMRPRNPCTNYQYSFSLDEIKAIYDPDPYILPILNNYDYSDEYDTHDISLEE